MMITTPEALVMVTIGAAPNLTLALLIWCRRRRRLKSR